MEWWMWVLGLAIVIAAAWAVFGAMGFRRNVRGRK
jgi:hypothetical protein